ncbi:MAG TPA: alpha-L-fucosidase [Candidatus Aquilonibacter sp.]|nr:alpha-L-fucosidase [Candidatus Aquilonibacter sp.]
MNSTRLKLFSHFALATLLLAANLRAQDMPLPPPPTDTPLAGTNDTVSLNRLAWWSDARFGMFIHWGLYSEWGCHWPSTNGKVGSIPANLLGANVQMISGGSEHMMQRLQIPLAQYAKIADLFDPTNFSADEWVSIAKNAGMKYIVITAKHHDGFAMFNSPSSDYNIVKMTPWHRDPCQELADACAKRGLKFGVYYSLGRDWQDPDCPTKNGYRSNTWDYTNESAKVFDVYFRRKVIPQITELLTQYHPAILWFDTPEEISAAESQELLDLIRKLEPNCIVDSRIGHGLGDYEVDEQKIPTSGGAHPWETCMTLNGHWGYFLGDEKWKSPETIIRNIVDIASKGGNYLLNVGPTGQGIIPQGAVNDLQQIGAWMKVNGESIYGTTASPLKMQPSWGRVTQKVVYTLHDTVNKNGNAQIDGVMVAAQTNLYLHVFNWPQDGKLPVALPPMKLGVEFSAHFLADGKTVPVQHTGDALTITLPPKSLDPIDTVVVLQF